MKWELSDLVSPADIAWRCGISKSLMANWVRRYGDFPKHLHIVGNGFTRLYSWRQVVRWCEESPHTRGKVSTCGDFPASCNCDDPTTHDWNTRH